MGFDWFRKKNLTFGLKGGVNFDGEIVAEYSGLLVVDVPKQRIIIPKDQIVIKYFGNYLKRAEPETTLQKQEGYQKVD